MGYTIHGRPPAQGIQLNPFSNEIFKHEYDEAKTAERKRKSKSIFMQEKEKVQPVHYTCRVFIARLKPHLHGGPGFDPDSLHA